MQDLLYEYTGVDCFAISQNQIVDEKYEAGAKEQADDMIENGLTHGCFLLVLCVSPI